MRRRDENMLTEQTEHIGSIRAGDLTEVKDDLTEVKDEFIGTVSSISQTVVFTQLTQRS